MLANVIDDNVSIDPVDDNYNVSYCVNQEELWPNSGRFLARNVGSHWLLLVSSVSSSIY